LKTRYLATTALLLTLSALAQAQERTPKLILGWLESAHILGSDMRIKVKLDPGAKTSSMQATNIERFDEDVDTEKKHALRLEGPLVRDAVIKRHGAPSVTRPVVTQVICLHNQLFRTEFTLADRGNFNYTMLLGRSFLSKVAIVDSSATFLSRPNCKGDNTVVEIDG
jgi:hypothetical protein